MTTAAIVRTRVEAAESGAFFVAADFEGSRRAVEGALSRLATAGSLLRVRKGIYWKGVKSRFGSGLPRSEEIALKVAGDRGVGPTGWSASHFLGLSTQVPSVPEFVVVGVPPTGLRDVIFHSRRNVARVGLNYFEIAVLETLRYWPTYVEMPWSDFVKRVGELRDEGKVNLNSVYRAATREKSPALRDRLSQLREDLAAVSP